VLNDGGGGGVFQRGRVEKRIRVVLGDGGGHCQGGIDCRTVEVATDPQRDCQKKKIRLLNWKAGKELERGAIAGNLTPTKAGVWVSFILSEEKETLIISFLSSRNHIGKEGRRLVFGRKKGRVFTQLVENEFLGCVKKRRFPAVGRGHVLEESDMQRLSANPVANPGTWRVGGGGVLERRPNELRDANGFS